MHSNSRRSILFLLLLITFTLFGCTQDTPLNPPAGDPGAMAGKAIPAGYYDTVDESSSAALRATLHAVIDDHTKIPYTSTATDTWNVLELADQDPNDSGRILDVYLNASYPKYGEGNTDYNREHTWPKSYGFPDDLSSNYPYTDCHHLFLSNDSYNTSRSNKPYRYGSAADLEKPTEVNDGMGGGTGTYPGNSNWTSGQYTEGTWETWIGRRGDVARALLYMDVRYEGGTHGITGHSEPDLILTDNESLIAASNTGSMESVGYMGMLSVLLEWHVQDPVDDRERARNDAVYAYQGNRNPFIDHPEWVECVFSGTCGGGGDTTPPAAPTGLGAVAGDGSVDLDWADSGEGDLAGYTVYRATTAGGPYGALNGALLTGSLYTDATAVNGTTYYYVVTATDTSANESGYSAEVGATPSGGGTGGGGVWINEFHYDNDSTDTGEFFEIAGTAGTSLAGWQVIGYNGNGGVVYDTENLSGTLPDQQAGFGTLSFPMAGMQNGSPDGLALVDDTGSVVMFISYEGSFTAVGGPADGMTSVDIGVSEPTTSPVGWSLQLAGTGAAYADFTWQSPAANTAGAVNNGQTFIGGPSNEAPVAEANGPYGGEAGVAVSFSSAGSTDSDGAITGYDWDFGDGGSSTLANPSHVYAAPGNYTVTLTVTDDDGATGGDTASAAIVDTTPPAVPTGLGATAGDGSVDLDWADNGEGDLAGYTVYRATTAGGPYTALNGTLLTGSLYTDNAVTNGTTYYYVVSASDGSGNESGQSAEVSALPAGQGGGDADVWINEFHYDNDGTDTGEFFEIAGPTGTDLSGWSVIGYNGNGGVQYDTVNLSGTLPATMGGYGVLSFAMAGMQNGSPDGLALIDGTGAVVMFISYEGSFVATDGPAVGLTSTDIGVSEPTTSPVGWSLQLSGTGTSYADFTWQSPATGTSGAVNNSQTLGSGAVAPVADFSGTPTGGEYPLAVDFSDLSTGAPTSWSWTFGDGGSSTAQNPSHTYTTAGVYTVSLTASNAQGGDTVTKVDYITVTAPPPAPTADFSGTPVSGQTPLVVNFTDLSTDGPTAWSWTFGDGGTSTAQNPSHTYTAAGVYTVSLTASNAQGGDTVTKVDYITVTAPSGGSWQTITYDDFEAGMGSYTDGGGDMERYAGSYSHQGTYSADIQDNSGVASSFYHTVGHDVSGYTDLEVEFWFQAISMDNTKEDFWVQYWDGSTWQTVATFATGIEFENGVYYNEVVTIPAGTYNYPTDAKLRFMCDASGNRDDVFIDEIEFRGFGN